MPVVLPGFQTVLKYNLSKMVRDFRMVNNYNKNINDGLVTFLIKLLCSSNE